jgi:type IV pilus assembly protein PilE
VKNKSSGFTLLELMIVVVIVGVLAALALFNYNKYGYRARRADGKEMVMRVASAQERYYTNFNKYADDLTALGFDNKTCGTLGASEKCYYVVTTAKGADGTSQTYTLTGTPQAGQAGDACGNLTITNTGTKAPAAGLLPQNSNGNCW